jgi:2-polyprenyl-3-methyl-5-hydroxy-6-metoxy-1,4-benzoquinol methylase
LHSRMKAVKNTCKGAYKLGFREYSRLTNLHARRFLDDEDGRRRWQNPEAILAYVGLKAGFTFVDVGCGNGFFTVPAARLVGDEGTVYGLDAHS